MHHRLDAVHRLAHQVGVLEVAGVDAYRPRLVQRQQVGQHHLVPGREQFVRDMAADVARGSRHQDAHQPFTAPTRPLTK